jgi:transmembrane sensor
MDMNAETNNSDQDSAGDEAIEWFVRLRAGALSVEEQVAFEAWLAHGQENAAAFEDVLQMYGHLAGMNPLRRVKPHVYPKRRIFAVGLAAFAAASLALFVSFDEISAYLRSDYYAGVGERKFVTLEDGSRVQLDSKSSIKVQYALAERRLTLLEGEAWFEVAPDPARPFVVEAGGGTVTALGTAFDVAVEKSGTRVTVTEHRVTIASGGQSVVVEQGRQSAFGRDAGVQAPSAVDSESATAWRRGKLIMEKRPLYEVLSAIGRHHRGFISCIGSSACARRVSGVFGADDPLQSLGEIEASLGLKAVNLSNYVILLY